MRVILVRHGKTRWNEEGRLQGWKGEALSERGLREVEELSESLSQLKPDAVYSSDLRRAAQTAEMLMRLNSWRAPHVIDRRLREINHGLWEGMRVSEIMDLKNMQTVEGFRPPGGESFRDVAERVSGFISDLRSTGHKEVIVVGHQVSNAVFSLLAMGFSPDHRVFDLLSAGMVSSLGLLANSGRNLMSLVQFNTQFEEIRL
ncbi:MAG: histidine phosphatase family protein [candidate division WOR-3 bacterium]